MKKNNNEVLSNSFSTINTSTTIEGKVSSKSDLRIDGTINGDINSQTKIVFGPSAQVKGNVTCKNADISCTIVGNVYCDELLTLKSSAHIKGDIYTKKLVVESGAVFIGKCEMGDSRNAHDPKPVSENVLKTNLVEEGQ